MTAFSIVPGDDFNKIFTWTHDGDPIDLTGYAIEFILTVNGETTTLTEDDPEISVTEDEGQIEILIEDEDTAEWSGRVYYHLRVVSPSDLITTLDKGRVMIL